MTTGGDFCPADLDGGDLEGGGRREAVGGYRGPGGGCGSTGHQDMQRLVRSLEVGRPLSGAVAGGLGPSSLMGCNESH